MEESSGRSRSFPNVIKAKCLKFIRKPFYGQMRVNLTCLVAITLTESDAVLVENIIHNDVLGQLLTTEVVKLWSGFV